MMCVYVRVWQREKEREKEREKGIHAVARLDDYNVSININ